MPDRQEARSAAQGRRWSDCPICLAYFHECRESVIHAAASVGIKHDLTTNQALALYFKERHAKHP